MINYESYPFLNGTISIFSLNGRMRFVSLKDNEDDAVDEYQKWFNCNSLPDTNEYFYRNLVAGYLAGNDETPASVGFEGTDLQVKVWQALLTLPKGKTMSYQELAELVGYPKAIRAVASAVAKNPILVFGGCHRIVRADGSLGQYRAGVEWKRRLLDFEL